MTPILIGAPCRIVDQDWIRFLSFPEGFSTAWLTNLSYTPTTIESFTGVHGEMLVDYLRADLIASPSGTPVQWAAVARQERFMGPGPGYFRFWLLPYPFGFWPS